MGKSVITGVQAASFKNGLQQQIDFNAQLVDWEDTRKPGLAVHKFLKRDGAAVEYMGRDPHEVKMNLVFIGPTWADQYRNFLLVVDADPLGFLTHPILGNMNVAYRGSQGAVMNTETARDMYLVPISFIENSVDSKLAFKQVSLDQQDQNVTAYTSQALVAASRFLSAFVSVQNLCNAALSFSAGTIASLGQNILDPTLSHQLAALQAFTETAVDNLLEDPISLTPAISQPSITACELVYDACVQMFTTVAGSRPPTINFSLPTIMHIATLASFFYGKDGRNRIDEILANNPGIIPNPSAIAAGTVLLMQSPTIQPR